MALPKQVQAELDAAELIEQQLAQSQPPADDAPADPPAADPPEPPAPEATPVAVEPSAEELTFKQRYLSLQGMYNAEVPRLNAQVRELTQKVNELTAAAAPAPKVEAPAAPAQSLITDADVEAYGADLIELMKRSAQETARAHDARLAQLEAENAHLKAQVGGVAEQQSMSQRQSYLAQLAGSVPDYVEVNADQGFLDWLLETDPLSGVVRQAYLDDAFARFDVTRTAALFDAYKAGSRPATTPASRAPQARSRELQSQIAPGTARASAAATPSNAAKSWSMAEVQSFYTDVAKGKYKGQETEQLRIEAEIDLAMAQGRLTA